MIVYLLLAIFPLLLTMRFPNYQDNLRQKKAYYFRIIAVYVFFVGLRSTHLGSTDTFQYVNGFFNSARYDDLSTYLSNRTVMEIGYNTFEWVLSHIFNFKSAILIVTAILFIVAICYFADKNSDDPAFTIFLYITIELFLFNLQGLRQSMAMAFCLFAYEFAKKRKLLPFLLIVIVAVTFHRSAIVFLPVYFLYGLKVTRNRILIYVPASVIFLYASDYLINLANRIFSFGDINRVYTVVADSGGYATLMIHLFFLVFSLFAIMQFDDIETGKRNSLLFYVSLLSLICFAMRYFGAREAERISFYFAFAQLALFPNTLNYFSPSNKKALKLIVFMGAIVLFISKLINNNFLPYQFFWSN